MLREKFISKDDKLLSTFKKITEINATKMAEKPDFVLTTVSNLDRLKKQNFGVNIDHQHTNGLNVILHNIFFHLFEYYIRVLFTQSGNKLPRSLAKRKSSSVVSKRSEENAYISNFLDNAMIEPRRNVIFYSIILIS